MTGSLKKHRKVIEKTKISMDQQGNELYRKLKEDVAAIIEDLNLLYME